jgi:hypothetical protein
MKVKVDLPKFMRRNNVSNYVTPAYLHAYPENYRKNRIKTPIYFITKCISSLANNILTRYISRF